MPNLMRCYQFALDVQTPGCTTSKIIYDRLRSLRPDLSSIYRFVSTPRGEQVKSQWRPKLWLINIYSLALRDETYDFGFISRP